MRHIIAICLVLSVFLEGFGQRPSGRPGGQAKTVTVTGSVIDAASNSPLEYATVSVYDDNRLVNGTITDLDGRFELALKPGMLRFVVEYISFATLERDSVLVQPGQTEIAPFVLSADAEVLAEVEVKAERSQVQMQLDKKVFNVGRDINSRAGTAQDVLDNVPSVTVDIEGNVELRGNGNVRVLINGRPSGVSGVRGANALRTIQASQIERVEVITNPGARFEAEGMAGIINIVLKKNKAEGFNASFDVQVGYPRLLGLGANLNYRKNKINWFANIGGRNRRAPGNGSSDRRFLNGQSPSRTTQQRNHSRGGTQGTFQGGLDYYIDDKNSITTSLQFERARDPNRATLIFEDYDLNNTIFRGTERNETEVENETEIRYDLNYTHQIAKNHRLRADFQYSDQTEEEASDFVNQFVSGPVPSGSYVPERITMESSANTESETRYRASIDYEKPLWKDGKIEMGYLGDWRTVANDFRVFTEVDGEQVPVDNLTNQLNYTENIQAGYVTLGSTFNYWSVQGGLRLEYADIVTELLRTGERNPRDFLNLFPSLFISRKLSDAHSLQVSYSRRVRRPRFFELNPFLTFSDNRNVFGGNPDLNPEFTDSYELNHIAYLGEITLSSGLYFRNTTEVIQRIVLVSDNESARTIPANVATQNSYGLELNIGGPISKDIRINANLNVFGFDLDGAYQEQTFDQSDIAMLGRLTGQFKLPGKIDGQIRYNYRGAAETVQGRRDAIQFMDLGFSRDILNGNGTLTFNVRDLFNTRRRQAENIGPDFIFNSEFQWRVRQWTMTFNYRLNQKKKRPGREGGYEGGEF